MRVLGATLGSPREYEHGAASAADVVPLPFVVSLVAAASVFYLAPWPIIYVPALVVVAVLTWWRLDLALALVILFAPYFMLPKHIGHEEFAPSEIFLLLDVAVAVSYVVWPREGLRPDVHALRRSPFLLPALLFLAAAIISTVLAADRHDGLRYLRLWIIEPELFFALLLLFVNGRRWRLLFGSLVAAGLAVGGIAVVQFATQQDVTVVAGIAIPRVKGPYGSPDNLGLLYDRVIPVWFALALAVASGRRRWLRWAPAVVLLPALALTFSRGAWFAVAVACLLIVAATVTWGRWVILACGALAVITVAVAGPTVAHALRAGHANTVQRRLDLWQSSLHLIRDHPILGIGPDNFLHYYAPTRQEDRWQQECSPGLGYMMPGAGAEPCLSHPHNEVFDVWLNTGVVGLGAFIWLQVVFWRRAWRSLSRHVPERALYLGATGAMLAALLHGLVDNSYFLVDLALVFWLLCAFVSEEEPGRLEQST